MRSLSILFFLALIVTATSPLSYAPSADAGESVNTITDHEQTNDIINRFQDTLGRIGSNAKIIECHQVTELIM
jgi:ABC-type uncharacterized transport system substrate-binding protein